MVVGSVTDWSRGSLLLHRPAPIACSRGLESNLKIILAALSPTLNTEQPFLHLLAKHNTTHKHNAPISFTHVNSLLTSVNDMLTCSRFNQISVIIFHILRGLSQKWKFIKMRSFNNKYVWLLQSPVYNKQQYWLSRLQKYVFICVDIFMYDVSEASKDMYVFLCFFQRFNSFFHQKTQKHNHLDNLGMSCQDAHQGVFTWLSDHFIKQTISHFVVSCIYQSCMSHICLNIPLDAAGWLKTICTEGKPIEHGASSWRTVFVLHSEPGVW